nr:ABC transporter substrate-binding protein [uncultured Roseovarius sp.]
MKPANRDGKSAFLANAKCQAANGNMMDRRSFMQRSLALGVSTAAASAVYSQARAAEPKRGGHFRVGVKHGSTSDSLNPELNNGTHTLLDFTWRGYLVEMDENGMPVPGLAESWEASNGAKSWAFKLRAGVEFHNGKPLEPQDVVNSINVHRGEDSMSPAKPLVAGITNITIDGDYVKIEMDSGNADLPLILASSRFSIHPATADGIDWQMGSGAGAYTLDSYEPGIGARLTKNPNFWNSDQGFFDSVEIISLIDPAARMNALVTDAVDAIDNVELKTAKFLGRNRNLTIIENNGGQHFTFPMRTDMAPFDDNNVRLALKYAIDRQKMVDTILLGYGSPANDHPISPANPYHDADLEQRTYDPDRAKYHLKQAGLDSLAVKLHVSEAAFAGAVDAATIYSEHARPAGIELTPVRETNDGYWSDVWKKKPWCASYWGGQPSADMQFTQAFAADADWNDAYWKNDRFNELLVSARSELDEKKRRDMYGEMQRIVKDDGGTVIPMFANNVFAVSNKIGHGKIQPLWELDSLRACVRWWFK